MNECSASIFVPGFTPARNLRGLLSATSGCFMLPGDYATVLFLHSESPMALAKNFCNLT